MSFGNDGIGIHALVDWTHESLELETTSKRSSAQRRMMLQWQGAVKMCALSVGKTTSRRDSGKVTFVSAVCLLDKNSLATVDLGTGEARAGRARQAGDLGLGQEVPGPESHKTKRGQRQLMFCMEAGSAHA